jgi:hypothetical protein
MHDAAALICLDSRQAGAGHCIALHRTALHCTAPAPGDRNINVHYHVHHKSE